MLEMLVLCFTRLFVNGIQEKPDHNFFFIMLYRKAVPLLCCGSAILSTVISCRGKG